MTPQQMLYDLQIRLRNLVDSYMRISDRVQQVNPTLHNEISDGLRTLNKWLAKFQNWLDDLGHLGSPYLVLAGATFISAATAYAYIKAEIGKVEKKIEFARELINSLPENERTAAIQRYTETNTLPTSGGNVSVDLGLGLRTYIPLILAGAGLMILYNMTK